MALRKPAGCRAESPNSAATKPSSKESKPAAFGDAALHFCSRQRLPAAAFTGLTRRGFNHAVSRCTPMVGKNLLPKVNRVASLMKRWLLGTHQGAVSHHLLSHYLNECTFRFNRRSSKSRGLLFNRLSACALS
jgi:hypothetical protein